VPPGIHQWSKFVQPQELTEILERCGCTVSSPPLCDQPWMRNTTRSFSERVSRNVSFPGCCPYRAKKSFILIEITTMEESRRR
ncbi:hypothetical protein OESDEN_23261, partial [Oesophagostomum dentatum]